MSLKDDVKQLQEMTMQAGRGEVAEEHLARRAWEIGKRYEENGQKGELAKALGFKADTTPDQLVTGILKRAEIYRLGYEYRRTNP